MCFDEKHQMLKNKKQTLITGKVHRAPSKPTVTSFAVHLFAAETCSKQIINISFRLICSTCWQTAVYFHSQQLQTKKEHSLSLIHSLLALFFVYSNS